MTRVKWPFVVHDIFYISKNVHLLRQTQQCLIIYELKMISLLNGFSVQMREKEWFFCSLYIRYAVSKLILLIWSHLRKWWFEFALQLRLSLSLNSYSLCFSEILASITERCKTNARKSNRSKDSEIDFFFNSKLWFTTASAHAHKVLKKFFFSA